MTQDEALKLALEALEKLWNIIDDIDTYGDMAKDDEKLYRSLVERRQRTRFEETGITTDGYELSGGAITAIKEALAQPEQEPVACIVKGCSNHRHEGKFVGDICSPCHTFITTGEGKFSQAYRNTQRTWQGLTDWEINSVANNNNPLDGIRTFARVIEAKLKQKNGFAEEKNT